MISACVAKITIWLHFYKKATYKKNFPTISHSWGGHIKFDMDFNNPRATQSIQEQDNNRNSSGPPINALFVTVTQQF